MRRRMGDVGIALMRDVRRRLGFDDRAATTTTSAQSPALPLRWVTQAMRAKVDLEDSQAIESALERP